MTFARGRTAPQTGRRRTTFHLTLAISTTAGRRTLEFQIVTRGHVQSARGRYSGTVAGCITNLTADVSVGGRIPLHLRLRPQGNDETVRVVLVPRPGEAVLVTGRVGRSALVLFTCTGAQAQTNC